jgi:two-component system nitrate/nitrite response regulator NarL
VLQKLGDPHNSNGEAHQLTRREAEVARLIQEGLANKVVAGRLGVKEGTVKIHLHNIYRKLRVSNRSGLILRVIASAQTSASPRVPGKDE